MRTKYLNRVTESSFIRWYFDDDKDFFANFGNTVALEIQKTGKCNLTIKKIFDECEYIPSKICESQFNDEEYQPHEVKLIKDIT